MSQIYDPTPAQLPRIWAQVEPLLWRGLKSGHALYEPLDVFVQVCQGTAKLWIAIADDKRTIEFAAATKLMDYPLGRTLSVFLGASLEGAPSTWRPLLIDTIEAYARSQHCREIESGGRLGWSRVWPGAAKTGVMLRKVL